jgi:hypothetical protein
LSSSSQLECDPKPRANRFNAERGQPSKGAETDLVRVKGEIQNIIAAVKQSLLHASMREALTDLEERKSLWRRRSLPRRCGHYTLIARV